MMKKTMMRMGNGKNDVGKEYLIGKARAKHQGFV